jgi:hypothetical protein
MIEQISGVLLFQSWPGPKTGSRVVTAILKHIIRHQMKKTLVLIYFLKPISKMDVPLFGALLMTATEETYTLQGLDVEIWE